MRWYGRFQDGTTYGRCSRRAMTRLMDSALQSALSFSDGAAWVRPPVSSQRFEGIGGYWQLSPFEISPSAIQWLGEKPRSDFTACGVDAASLSLVRLTAHRTDGTPLVGLCFIPDGVFYSDDVNHALWSEIGEGAARSEPILVMASSEKPLPHATHRCRLASHRNMSLYQCDNPACAAYRKPLLVPAITDFHGGSRIGAIAYPCPRCIGKWYERWALTWLRGASPEDMKTHSSVEYPVAPTETRRNTASGPLRVVVQATTNEEPWGWHPGSIRKISRGLLKFLRTKKQHDLVQAMSSEPERVGDLLLAMLQRSNLRSLVDYVRKLPIKKRVRGIPRAFGHAFCPKRPAAYRITQESIQADHHFYIAYSPDLFMGYLDYYGVADCPGAFLDVGSGIGEKPFIAYACGRFERCDGLEYDARTLAVGHFLLSQLQTDYRYPITYELADALQFERYGDYDVIYMYRPMRDKAMMRQLFLCIGEQMKIGATCMDVIEKDLAFRRIDERSYAAVSGVDEAGRAVWGPPRQLNEFLESMGFPAVESS